MLERRRKEQTLDSIENYTKFIFKLRKNNCNLRDVIFLYIYQKLYKLKILSNDVSSRCGRWMDDDSKVKWPPVIGNRDTHVESMATFHSPPPIMLFWLRGTIYVTSRITALSPPLLVLLDPLGKVDSLLLRISYITRDKLARAKDKVREEVEIRLILEANYEEKLRREFFNTVGPRIRFSFFRSK